jgi:MOSC domain-containing protein YiiM
LESERCGECRFDGDRWVDGDVLTTLPILGALLGEYVAGLDDEVLHRRYRRDQWSIAEYADQTRETLFAMRFLLGMALSTDEPDLGSAPSPRFTAEARSIDIAAALAGIDAESSELAEELAVLDMEQWSRGATIDGERVDVRWIARHAVHDATHHLHDIGRIRVASGHGTAPSRGSVVALHRSEGGVPKQPVTDAVVTWSGVEGDVQNDRRHHGRPFQALCLWSADVMDALVAEGHSVHPGAAGENITVAGVPWHSLRPGTIVRIGEVVGEISSYATPCAKNAAWFADGDFRRMDQDVHPGWSRLYAWVREPGTIRPGDPFEVEP